jgi:hypothetical protein
VEWSRRRSSGNSEATFRRPMVIGQHFDGNIQSLGSNFGFDPAVNRAVAVDAGRWRPSRGAG